MSTLLRPAMNILRRRLRAREVTEYLCLCALYTPAVLLARILPAGKVDMEVNFDSPMILNIPTRQRCRPSLIPHPRLAFR